MGIWHTPQSVVVVVVVVVVVDCADVFVSSVTCSRREVFSCTNLCQSV